jgi:16S rRNA (cytosine967-C5)-methyltransferase
MLQQLDSNLDNKASASIVEKFDLLLTQEGIQWQSVFPFQENLSEQIDPEFYTRSLFIQPDLFLRIRPGKEKQGREKLQAAQIAFKEISEITLSLPNSSKLEDVLLIDKEVVIQDLNSQKSVDSIIDFLVSKSKPEIWDCCAASGGKSILIHDLIPQSKLFLSDLRETILHNLRSRLARAGIKNFQSRVADASRDLPAHQFDLVICDAPCTGSGTWSRTPEQLFYFDTNKINQYSELQKKIVLNAGKAVREQGYFLYITCSVFKNENEDVVEFIQKNLPLKLESMQYFKGYENKADTLFAAAFSAAH